MSISRASRVKNEMCYILICVDEYDGGEIRGRLFNAYYREALFFDSGMEMIRELDDIFETFGYPHATMDLRSLETPEEKKEHPPVVRVKMAPSTTLYKHDSRGKLATLKMRVMFRQNASWQGNLKWMEEDLSEDFASVLELMILIDSVFAE